MKSMHWLLLVMWLLGTLVHESFGQVSEIRSASLSELGGSSGSSTSTLAIDLLINSATVLTEWQRSTLQRQNIDAALVSIEISAMAASQPSNYYIIHPRIRGNWGLFSTDLRFNYIVEEGIDGVRSIRTTDWQVLELNLVTSPVVNFYVGGGIITESYEQSNTYTEFSAALALNPRKWPIGFYTEYRFSEPRLEFSGQIRRVLFGSETVTLSVGAGAIWQQYYNTIHIWGFQAGLTARLF
jgi:hypothetical protein